MKILHKKQFFILLFLISLLSICLNKEFYKIFPNNSTIQLFQLKEGQSFLINTKNNVKILVNGGKDDQIIEKLSNHLSFFDNTIDIIVVTQDSEASNAGILSIMNRLNIKKILIPPYTKNTPLLKRIIEKAKKHNVPIDVIHTNNDIAVTNDIFLDFELHEDIFIGRVIQKNASPFIFSNISKASDIHPFLLISKAYWGNHFIVPHQGDSTIPSQKLFSIISPQKAYFLTNKDSGSEYPHTETLHILGKQKTPFSISRNSGDIIISL